MVRDGCMLNDAEYLFTEMNKKPVMRFHKVEYFKPFAHKYRLRTMKLQFKAGALSNLAYVFIMFDAD